MNHVITPPSATKRVFRVNVRSVDSLWILVEADTVSEATNLAENIDAGFFNADWDNTDWQIVGVEVATEYHPDQVAPPEAYNSL
jgi:hypothetical protein